MTMAGFASATPGGCFGQRNTGPVLYIEPIPLKTVPHGQSWVMKQDTSIAYLARLSGTAYEMGYAYGELFSNELTKQYKNAALMYPQIGYSML